MRLGREFDIIKGIVNTEKTSRALSENKYTFNVDTNANKDEIKSAIEKVFGVEVLDVNIINSDGKVKRFKGTMGQRVSTKKAVVTIKKGQDINFGKLE